MGKIVLTYDQPSGTNWVRKSRAHCTLCNIYVHHNIRAAGWILSKQIRLPIHCSFNALNIILPACGPHAAEFSRITIKAWLSLRYTGHVAIDYTCPSLAEFAEISLLQLPAGCGVCVCNLGSWQTAGAGNSSSAPNRVSVTAMINCGSEIWRTRFWSLKGALCSLGPHPISH
jgi:hypothetical protein